MFILCLISVMTLFQPHYEKVACLFNGANAVHPGLILMTRVDCAEKVLLLYFIDSLPFILSFAIGSLQKLLVVQHL